MGEVIVLRPKGSRVAADALARRERLGRMIRFARGDLTQVHLGELLGVSQPAISAWEAGKVSLSAEVLWSIEAARDLQHGWLSVAAGYVDPDLEPLITLLQASVAELQ